MPGGSGRLLLVDLDDTLIDRTTAYRRWAEDFLRRRGLLSAESVAAMLEADGSGLQRREDMLQRVLDRVPLSESLDDLIADYDARVASFFDPVSPEVVAALEALRAAGWIVGLCTNGYQAQVTKVEMTGLAPHLDGWFVTGLHGTWKPEKAAFTGAAALLGGSLDGAWMVGDGGPTDIQGAHGAGISSVWVSGGRPWPAGLPFSPTLIAPTGAAALQAVLRLPTPA